jgi:hypothetical protein
LEDALEEERAVARAECDKRITEIKTQADLRVYRAEKAADEMFENMSFECQKLCVEQDAKMDALIEEVAEKSKCIATMEEYRTKLELENDMLKSEITRLRPDTEKSGGG